MWYSFRSSVSVFAATVISLSLSIEHELDPIFSVSIVTVGGFVSDLDYDIKEGAGNSTDNVLIKINYNAIIEVMNYWEEYLKYGDNPFQIIVKVPGFIGLVWDLYRNDEIIIEPVRVILRLTNLLELISTIGKYTTPAELGSSL